MAVKLRLTRFGRLNHPTYRVCATESRFKRDGRVIETLGFYLPKHCRVDEQVSLNAERIAYWLSVGAQPSETVASMIKRAGIEMPTPKKKVKGKSKAKPKAFAPPHSIGKGRNTKARWKAKNASAATAAE